MTSVFIDWQEEFQNNFDKWENETQQVLKEILEDPENPEFKKVAERLGVLESDGSLNEYWEESLNDYNPMMNYGHILKTTPEDRAILEVALKTNCSVMYNTETSEHYIVLNGGGMDLSQDIGLSYVILEKWIPEDFISQISKQKGLSISKADFSFLKNAIITQAEVYKSRFENLIKEWQNL